MSKKIFVPLIMLLLSFACVPSHAQVKASAPLRFVMPTGVDPEFLDFSFDGEIKSFKGLKLLPETYDNSLIGKGVGGLEPRVNHSVNSGIQFFKFVITTDYAGGFTLISIVDPAFSQFAGKEWLVSPGPGSGMVLEAQGESPLVGEPVSPATNDFRYFAHIGATSDNFDGVNDFAAATFTMQGFAVPEPGTWTIAISLLLSVAIATSAWRRVRG